MIKLRPALSLSLAVMTAVAVLPASSATAKKDSSAVTHIAYQQWDSDAELAGGTHAGTTVTGNGIVLEGPTESFSYTDPWGDASAQTYDVGTWTSPEVTPGFAYTELVASWNADTPAGTWIQVSVAGKADNGLRSKSYVLGRWAEGDDTIHRTSVPAQGDDLATVAIDTLVARAGRTLSTWQLTVSLFRAAGTTATPSVSLVGAMASQLPESKKRIPASPLGGAEGITLEVPTYSQEIHIGEYPQYNGGGEAWCSPTSTSMVLAYWQQTKGAQYGPAPAEYESMDPQYDDMFVDYAAASTYDYNYDGTGNWPFNTAYAGRYDLESFVTRLRSLTEAEQFIKAGIPLVVSISFKESELDGAGYGTNGHLMVIVGFTEDGDVVANDPASHLIESNEEVRTVYDREQFENVWIPKSGGIAYVIHPTDVPLPPSPAERNW
ncbi:MAG: peptidase C39 family protein [Actinomycetota bacterium]|nr:peptidase C39 family protein [Actinomycetota bacterium]